MELPAEKKISDCLSAYIEFLKEKTRIFFFFLLILKKKNIIKMELAI